MIDFAELSERSGYPVAFLAETFAEYAAECADDGEPVDMRYFVGVTLERDW